MNKYIENFINHERNFKSDSENTIKYYSTDLRQMFEYLIENKNLKLEDQHIREITKEDLEDFIANVKGRGGKPASANTKNRKIASMRSFFEYLEGRVIDVSPSKKIKRLKVGEKQPRYLDIKETQKLLKVIDNKRDYTIYSTFLFTGTRLSELVDIDIRDIKGNTLLIRGKGSKERVVNLSEKVQEIIREWILARPDVVENGRKPLFVTEKNMSRISIRAVQDNLKRYIKKADLDKDITVHKLRHTAATLMYSGGVGVVELKEILGHSNISTTNIYTHVENESLQKAVDSNPLNNII